MDTTLLKALLALVPACALLAGSAVLFLRVRSFACFLQLFGTICLLVVIVAHVCEGLGLFPSMGWGLRGSLGHYLDLSSAILAVSLFAIGYVFHAFTGRDVQET
jgi:hypothetical protein